MVRIAPSGAHQETAWELFDHWSAAGRVDAMHGLAPAVLARRSSVPVGVLSPGGTPQNIGVMNGYDRFFSFFFIFIKRYICNISFTTYQIIRIFSD